MPPHKSRRITQIHELIRHEVLNAGDMTPEEADKLSDDICAIAFPELVPSNLQRMVGALGRALGLEPSLNGGHIDKLAKDVLAAGYTPDQLDAIYDIENKDGFWYKDWRSGKVEKHHASERDLRLTIKGFAERLEKYSKPVSMDDL